MTSDLEQSEPKVLAEESGLDEVNKSSNEEGKNEESTVMKLDKEQKEGEHKTEDGEEAAEKKDSKKVVEEKTLEDLIKDGKKNQKKPEKKEKAEPKEKKEDAPAADSGKKTEDKLAMSLDDVMKADKNAKKSNKSKGKNKKGDKKGGGENDVKKKFDKKGGSNSGRNYDRGTNYGRRDSGKNDWYESDYYGKDWYGGYGKGGGPRDYYDDRRGGGKDRYYDDYGYGPSNPRYGQPPPQNPRYQPYDAGQSRGGGQPDYTRGYYKDEEQEKPSRRGNNRSSRDRGGNRAHCMIRVTNVPAQISGSDLRDAFQQCGRIESCDTVRGKTGEFVLTYTTQKDASSAIQKYDGGTLNQQKIKVQMC
ncbi:unnamed protein product [Amoebophrya sp. A120]|nr:unnamed protein product [Amoebophrya sp. A120]|eukprot:GSA120T00010392001.1